MIEINFLFERLSISSWLIQGTAQKKNKNKLKVVLPEQIQISNWLAKGTAPKFLLVVKNSVESFGKTCEFPAGELLQNFQDFSRRTAKNFQEQFF